jgi:hypothetical protein
LLLCCAFRVFCFAFLIASSELGHGFNWRGNPKVAARSRWKLSAKLLTRALV